MGGNELPKRQLLTLALCRFCQPFAIASTFAFFPEYIEYLGVPSTRVPLWVGILAASFNIGECLSAFPCTSLADRFGRRPVLVTSVGLSLIFNLLIGFCNNMLQAFICIVLAGLMNGNVAVMRTSVAELVPCKGLQPRAFAFLPTAAGLGTILGPVVGGTLAHPSERYPELFSTASVFLSHPFALPTTISAALFFMAFVMALFVLRETRKGYNLLPTMDDHEDRTQDELHLDKYPQETSDDSYVAGEQDNRIIHASPASRLRHFTNLAIWMNAICGLHSVAFDHMLPVFLHQSSDRSGYRSWIRFASGFGKDSRFIGVLLTIAGIFGMATTIVAVPRLVKLLGNKGILHVTAALFPAIYIIFPWSSLPALEILRVAILAILVLVKVAISVSALQSCLILITNSVSSVDLASAHGVNFALASTARGIGSLTSGVLFSYGVIHHFILLPFWVLASWSLLGLLLLRSMHMEKKSDGM